MSGVGSWRYVDCVAIRAGKLQALEYVRTLYGVPLDRCVAAGDSGNDILMLEGPCCLTRGANSVACIYPAAGMFSGRQLERPC